MVSCANPPPPGLITQTCVYPSAPVRANAIFFPSGDHAGSATVIPRAPLKVSRRRFSPLASITKSSECPVRPLSKASWR